MINRRKKREEEITDFTDCTDKKREAAWAEAHPTRLIPSPDEYIRRCHPSISHRGLVKGIKNAN